MTTALADAPVHPDLKPHLRGWLHAGAAPLSVVAGVVLIVLAPAGLARVAACAYAIPFWLLFGVSAVYHRGTWQPAQALLLKRLDHSNIYLVIAGTYTPFVLLGLHGSLRGVMLSSIWGVALAGVAFRVFAPHAPRWLIVGLYLVLPLGPAFILPILTHRLGAEVVALILTGGLVYIVGGVVYGLQRPNPSLTWYGFHELFHSCTLIAYTFHYVAVSLVVYRT